MTIPIAAQNARLLSQQVLAKGLQQLLQSGPQRGLVLQSKAGGKAVIQLVGGQFPLDVEGQKLEAGDRVLLRLINNQIALEILSSRGESAEAAKTALPHTLANQLAQMGLSGAHFETIANALIAAGVPLDKTVLRQLAQLLPQLPPQAFHALAFLFSRRFPVSDAVLQYLTKHLGGKTKIKESADDLFRSLDELDSALDEDDEGNIDPDSRREFHERREQLEQHMISLQEQNDPPFEEKIEAAFQSALTTEEASMAERGNASGSGYQDALLQLLAILLRLQAQLQNPAHELLLQQVIQQIRDLRDSLNAQAIRNAPRHDTNDPPTVYFQIPVMERKDIRNLEVRYRAKSKDKDNQEGTLELRLELSALGPLYIQMQWQESGLTISIASPDQSVADLLQPVLHELEDALQKQGFPNVRLQVAVREIPDSLEPEDDVVTLPPPTGIDVKI